MSIVDRMVSGCLKRRPEISQLGKRYLDVEVGVGKEVPGRKCQEGRHVVCSLR